jgi:hypothetical protein
MGFFSAIKESFNKADGFSSLARISKVPGRYLIAFKGISIKESRNDKTMGDISINVDLELVHVFSGGEGFSDGDMVSLGWMIPSNPKKAEASPKLGNFKSFVGCLVGISKIADVSFDLVEKIEKNPEGYMNRELILVVGEEAKTKTGNAYNPTSFFVYEESDSQGVPPRKHTSSQEASSEDIPF